jgi:predicted ATPase/transcriptional regulator with XRE-family HTH domain
MPASLPAVPLASFTTFGDLLKYLRRRARLTQRELSIAVGYSEGQISRLEQNQRLPDLAAVTALLVPALDLENEPALVARLLELAAAARGEALPASVTFTRAVVHVTEEVDALESPPLGNLPLPLTTFIGREQATAEVERLLATARLVTLVGAGGCGKTRLALQVAGAVTPRYQEGAWLVELAPLTDPALVGQAIASALGVQEETDRPLLAALTSYLRARHLLLLLDNCEHVVAGAAQQAEALLRACPHLRILATSRETLGVAGEALFAVPPLAIPDPEHLPPLATLSHYEAVRLFVERAQSALPLFNLTNENARAVAEVCCRLDGIPLAIELAAARVKLLPVEQIAARLGNGLRLLSGGSRTALPRQQTLQATIEWSYNLLPAAEQALLRRLSVFAGGWTLAAAEAVASDQWSMTSAHSSLATGHWSLVTVLDGLASLVNKSLVIAEREPGREARYRLLVLIRHYAHEKLLAAGEEQPARQRHLSYFLALAETAEPKLRGPDQVEWLHRLEQERDNFRLALAWALAEDLENGLRLLVSLWHFWSVRSYRERWEWLTRFMAARPWPRTAASARALSLAAFQAKDAEEAARLFAESMALGQALGDRQGMAFSLALQGLFAWWRDPELARTRFGESLALYRESGDRWNEAGVLLELGELLQVHQEDRAVARAVMAEGLALYRELNDKRGMANSLVHLGDISTEQGDLAAGEAYCQEGLSLSTELGYHFGMTWGLMCLGIVAWGRGDYEQAVIRLEECLRLAREVDATDHTVLALYWLGNAFRFAGEPGQAAEVYQEGLALSRERGIKWGIAHCLYGLGEVARSQGVIDSAHSHHVEALDHLRALDFRWAIANSLEALAHLAVAQRQMERAVRLFSAAEALRQGLGAALYPVEQVEHNRSLATVRAALGDEALAAMWAEGKAMSLEQAIQYALHTP